MYTQDSRFKVFRILVSVLIVSVLSGCSVFALSFSDDEWDTPSEWAKNEINLADELGIIPVDLRNFQAPITRREFCYIINNYLLYAFDMSHEEFLAYEGLNIEDYNFGDTDDYQVRFSSAVGLVNGVGDGRFDPDSTLDRQQAATILMRMYFIINGPELTYTPTPFVDRNYISNWALEAVDVMAELGVTRGYPDGSFRPKVKLSVEQAIAMTVRIDLE